jgi:Holliday junction resolvase RusA-like endonuclease
MVFDFFVEGIPKAQPRARAYSRGGHIRMYNPDGADKWKTAVKAQSNFKGCTIIDPIELHLEFKINRPKSHYKSNGQLKITSPRILHDQKPDADNLAKAVMDALSETKIWDDDDQVCDLRVIKNWVSQDGIAGCRIVIKTMKESFNY